MLRGDFFLEYNISNPQLSYIFKLKIKLEQLKTKRKYTNIC